MRVRVYLPPMTTMCKTLRAQCISVWIWKILTVCVREDFLLCRDKQNGEVCEKGRQRTGDKQTNKDGSTGWQAAQLTGSKLLMTDFHSFFYTFCFFFFVFCHLAFFILLSCSWRLDVKCQIVWHFIKLLYSLRSDMDVKSKTKQKSIGLSTDW